MRQESTRNYRCLFKLAHGNMDLLDTTAKLLPFPPASNSFSIHLPGMVITGLPQQSPQIISHPTLVKQPWRRNIINFNRAIITKRLGTRRLLLTYTSYVVKDSATNSSHFPFNFPKRLQIFDGYWQLWHSTVPVHKDVSEPLASWRPCHSGLISPGYVL